MFTAQKTCKSAPSAPVCIPVEGYPTSGSLKSNNGSLYLLDSRIPNQVRSLLPDVTGSHRIKYQRMAWWPGAPTYIVDRGPGQLLQTYDEVYGDTYDSIDEASLVETNQSLFHNLLATCGIWGETYMVNSGYSINLGNLVGSMGAPDIFNMYPLISKDDIGAFQFTTSHYLEADVAYLVGVDKYLTHFRVSKFAPGRGHKRASLEEWVISESLGLPRLV